MTTPLQLVVYLEELGGTLQLDESILEAGIELRDAIQAKCELLINNEVSFLLFVCNTTTLLGGV